MAQHDMRHLDFISSVAQEDIAYVDAKDRSYGGSWKRSGGRSAWFMVRRKIDRLLEFLDKPPAPQGFSLNNIDDTIAAIEGQGELPGTPDATAEILRYLRQAYVAEDIFKKIEEEPHGFDGSVLAEVRDLRRYLMLIEAEMIARGVVHVATNVPDSLLEKGMSDETQAKIHRAIEFAVNYHGLDARTNTPDFKLAEQLAPQVIQHLQGRTDSQIIDGTRRSSVEFAVTVDRLVPEPIGPGTPEDGGQHELAAIPDEPEPEIAEPPAPEPPPPPSPSVVSGLPSSGVPSFLGSMGTRLTRTPRKNTLASVPPPDPEPETPPVEVALVDQPFQPVESLRAEVRQWHREKSQRKVVEVKLQDGQVETATYDRATKQFAFDSGKDDSTVVEGWRPVLCRTCHKYSTEPCPFVGNDNAMGCEQYRTNAAEWPVYNEGIR